MHRVNGIEKAKRTGMAQQISLTGFIIGLEQSSPFYQIEKPFSVAQFRQLGSFSDNTDGH